MKPLSRNENALRSSTFDWRCDAAYRHLGPALGEKSQERIQSRQRKCWIARHVAARIRTLLEATARSRRLDRERIIAR